MSRRIYNLGADAVESASPYRALNHYEDRISIMATVLAIGAQRSTPIACVTDENPNRTP